MPLVWRPAGIARLTWGHSGAPRSFTAGVSLKDVGAIMMCTELCWRAEIVLKGQGEPFGEGLSLCWAKQGPLLSVCQGSLVTLLTQTEVIPFYLERVQGGNADLLRCL